MTTVMAVAKEEMPSSFVGNITENAYCVCVMWHKDRDKVADEGGRPKANAVCRPQIDLQFFAKTNKLRLLSSKHLIFVNRWLWFFADKGGPFETCLSTCQKIYFKLGLPKFLAAKEKSFFPRYSTNKFVAMYVTKRKLFVHLTVCLCFFSFVYLYDHPALSLEKLINYNQCCTFYFFFNFYNNWQLANGSKFF